MTITINTSHYVNIFALLQIENLWSRGHKLLAEGHLDSHMVKINLRLLQSIPGSYPLHLPASQAPLINIFYWGCGCWADRCMFSDTYVGQALHVDQAVLSLFLCFFRPVAFSPLCYVSKVPPKLKSKQTNKFRYTWLCFNSSYLCIEHLTC